MGNGQWHVGVGNQDAASLKWLGLEIVHSIGWHLKQLNIILPDCKAESRLCDSDDNPD